mmetsp:Transcript_44589/g.147812  ORF Transcript_44589/g.147812 Transcript_44589/m.147812 type:complete len:261 (+) Transcript_44589:1765-2547(+)
MRSAFGISQSHTLLGRNRNSPRCSLRLLYLAIISHCVGGGAPGAPPARRESERSNSCSLPRSPPAPAVSQSTSSTVGSPLASPPGASASPPPEAACRMGSTVFCSSFCFSSYSSFSADWFSSSQASAASIASVAFCTSDSGSFALVASSEKVLRSEYAYVSNELRASTLAAYAASASRFSSSSFTMRSISSSERRPFSARMVMSCFLPLDFSSAETVRIPFASTLKVTSICGMPRGIGGIAFRSNLPRMLLSLVKRRSPS